MTGTLRDGDRARAWTGFRAEDVRRSPRVTVFSFLAHRVTLPDGTVGEVNVPLRHYRDWILPSYAEIAEALNRLVERSGREPVLEALRREGGLVATVARPQSGSRETREEKPLAPVTDADR